MSDQLIVIGNGFDLTAKLKSTYDDFFNWYFGDRINGSETNKKDEINYWFELFWKLHQGVEGLRWSDIETVLLDELEKIDSNYYDYYQNRFDGVGGDATRNTIGEKLNTIEESITNANYYKKRASQLEYIGPDDKTERVQDSSLQVVGDPNAFYLLTNKQSFISSLYTDLLDLENEFIKFLNEIISKTGVYKINANQLISELIVKEYITKSLGVSIYDQSYFEKRNKFIQNKEVKTQILSFNYTHETKDETFVNADFYYNVHGSLLLGRGVFGIDGHTIGDNGLLFPFTKTYRIMNFDNQGFNLKKDLDIIKFFGHGLAEADYSYFQTIFDSIDLYNAKTKLIFYYNFYEGKSQSEIIESFKQAVFKLIRRYGQTLSNKDHGKNLLHKLIIEGRIKITELNTRFMRDKLDR